MPLRKENRSDKFFQCVLTAKAHSKLRALFALNGADPRKFVSELIIKFPLRQMEEGDVVTLAPWGDADTEISIDGIGFVRESIEGEEVPDDPALPDELKL